jgi:hypothetical protein
MCKQLLRNAEANYKTASRLMSSSASYEIFRYWKSIKRHWFRIIITETNKDLPGDEVERLLKIHNLK